MQQERLTSVRCLFHFPCKSRLVVIEPRVAYVGHLRPELLPVPFWQFAGKCMVLTCYAW